MYDLLLIPSMALANRWRGHDRGAWIGRTLGTLCVIYAFWHCHWWQSVLAGTLYHIGSIWIGWGKWIGIITAEGTPGFQGPQFDDKEGAKNGIRWLAEAIAPERRCYMINAIVALTLCGLYWWAPVIALSPVALWIKVVATLAVGVGFPLSFIIANESFDNTQDWKAGEVIYGAVQGLILYIIGG